MTELSPQYMLVSSQDDLRHRQMILEQGTRRVGEPTLMAKNHYEMSAFESPQDTPTQQA